MRRRPHSPLAVAPPSPPPQSVNVTIERQSFFEAEAELYEIQGLRGHRHDFAATKEGEYKVIYVADQHCVARPTKQPSATPRPPPRADARPPASSMRPTGRPA